MNRTYTSKEFAIKGSVTKKTLRHYCKLKLLEPSFIDENGYWYYNDSDMRKLEIIQSLKLLGLTLSEIKENMDTNFDSLKPLINDKIDFIDKQIEDLEIAKRLLEKIQNKESLQMDTALKESIEEDHLEWLKKNIDKNQLELVESMTSKDNSYEEHLKVMELIKDFKVYLSMKDSLMMKSTVDSIKKIFRDNQLNDETIRFMIEFIIKSSLDGPSYTRIVTEEESKIFLSMF